uniref:plasmid recombination protein n=1 Tax=Candidatus Limisoma sp. TaxID=3076476 RepID=UPI0040256035
VYKDEPIKQVYHELFDDALERYNSKQKRKDRCISDYYEHLRTGKQEKVFHELIVQIGDKDNTGVTTEDGQWAATIPDEYMQDFEKRNPTLRVFGAFLHMDEATPHLHIDFIPYVSGWKGKGMDTKVSLKQALKALGFAGGTKKESELNQWINAEKEQLAAVMERHGIEWEKKDTHEEHLSVLDFKKKERAKEVAELDAVKQEKQTELAQIQQQTQEAKRECQKQTKELNEIAPILQGLESLSAQYSQRPEEWVPEAGTFETAKSYRDKKAIPLINKLVKILYSLHHKYWKVKNECAKFMERYADEREANQNLRQRIEMLQEENTRLKAVEHNFGRVWSYYGAEQVKRVVELMAGRERAAQNVQRQKREHENVI